MIFEHEHLCIEFLLIEMLWNFSKKWTKKTPKISELEFLQCT